MTKRDKRETRLVKIIILRRESRNEITIATAVAGLDA